MPKSLLSADPDCSNQGHPAAKKIGNHALEWVAPIAAIGALQGAGGQWICHNVDIMLFNIIIKTWRDILVYKKII